MRAARTDEEGTVSHRMVRPTPRSPDARPLIDLIQEVLALGPVDQAVVGVPGRVHYGTGVLEHAPNLPPAWAEELSEARLATEIGVEVALANDADLAAVGEAWFGAGRRYRDVTYLTVSTGVGAGVVTGRLLVHGSRSLAEVGHSIVDWQGRGSGCSTVEQLGSGTALARRAEEAGLVADGREVERRRQAGDPVATAMWEAVVTVAGVAAVNLAQLFSPEVIVVGGGLGLVGEPVLSIMRRLLAESGPVGFSPPVAVVNAALGDDAALAGAGAWARAFVPQAASRV